MIYITILTLLNFYLGARLPGWVCKIYHCKIFDLFSSFLGECFPLPYQEFIRMKTIELVPIELVPMLSKQLHIQQHSSFALMKNKHGISGQQLLNPGAGC